MQAILLQWVLPLLLLNLLLGIILSGIFLNMKEFEFCRLLEFTSGEAEDVFIGDSSDPFRTAVCFVFFTSTVLTTAVLYFVFFVLRTIFFMVMKFPWQLGAESYRHIKYTLKKKKR